ncbi:MAG TPA: Mpo1-like protein [Polyangia bacterium]|jgi:hypothetical protein
MTSFLRALKEQRWDDHRYYHHSRINQSLHFISACTFLCTYVLLFTRPVAAALVGWLVAMVTRQVGHFFFEPKGYDEVNEATHAYKEDVKVGYNLRRKVILHVIWGLSPLVLLASPSLFGIFKTPYTDLPSFLHHMSRMWIVIGVGALLFRTVHLFFLRDVQTGLVWMTKILTDPFHDIWLYHKAPLALLRGEMIDPMGTQQQHA